MSRCRTLCTAGKGPVGCGVKVVEPDGAFYAFPDLSAFIGRGDGPKDDLALAERILERGKVALVPGSGFLAPGYARLSYATSMEKIEKGIDRLEKFVKELA